jgi:hypothetical protein
MTEIDTQPVRAPRNRAMAAALRQWHNSDLISLGWAGASLRTLEDSSTCRSRDPYADMPTRIR